MSEYGLSKREMEREVAWMLRSLPKDPQKSAKAVADALVSLMVKNNARIAEQMAASDPLSKDDQF